LRYLGLLFFPCVAVVSFFLGGAWTWSLVFIAFGVIPVMEFFMTPDPSNLSDEEDALLTGSLRYAMIPALFVPIQWGTLFVFLYQASNGAWVDPVAWIGATATLAICCVTFGINVGHDLGHRPERGFQHLGKFALMSSLYVHFFIEHNLGHHRHVSTEHDPASARRRETVYAFWVRSVIGSFRSAWNIAPAQMARLLFVQLLIWAALFYFAGVQAGIFAAIGAMGGALMLEVVNYIEHYGLHRRPLASGRYEQVSPMHSWNSDHPIGRVLLFELTRHSDHHANPRRAYVRLRSHAEAPQLPTGYPGMILLSMVPPLFFRVMDPLVERWDHCQREGVGWAHA